jgi:hypothetical protein
MNNKAFFQSKSSILNLFIGIGCVLITFHIMGQAPAASGISLRELESAKLRLEAERDAIFTEALHLSISQAADFHPIYSAYTKDKNELDEELIKLMVDYLEKYLDSEKFSMHGFIKRSAQFQRKEFKIRKKYFRKLKKEISPHVAAEFYELDDFCATVLRLNILTSLPMIQNLIQKKMLP